MQDFIKKVYLKQISMDCDSCMDTANRMKLLINDIEQGKATIGENEYKFFAELANFVNKTAAISRMFWPPVPHKPGKRTTAQNRAKKRGDDLLFELKIPLDSPIKNRNIRNNFEHYDERLDDWAYSSINKNFLNYVYGPRNAVSGIEDGDIIHRYNPETDIYSFRGKEFNIKELVVGVFDIQRQINSYFEKHGISKYLN